MMRTTCAVVGFAWVLAACGDNGPGPPPAEPDAAPSMPIDAPLYFEPCDSPAGTATITAAHQDLQPAYARMYAGGEGWDEGFAVHAFFTNEALTTTNDVFMCEQGLACTSVGFVVDVTVDRGDELGVHTAQIRNSASTWEASGTVTLTDFVYPDANPGHLAGSISVDSTSPLVTIDGSFDHSFCLGLVGYLLP